MYSRFMDTKLDAWEILQAVVHLGGFAPVAEKLNRSQSTISYAVGSLQEQLGVRLFCCLSARPAGPPNLELEKKLAAVKTAEDSSKLGFFERAQLATAAWSPDPKNPPLYLDLASKDGVVQNDVLAKWAANSPLLSSISTSEICGSIMPSPWM